MLTYAEKKWGNCDSAVAYQLNFVKFCYGYDSDSYDDYYILCEKCKSSMTQKKNYEYPKSSFSKNKDYYILDTYDFAVSKELMEYMLAFGVSKDNFMPIFTRKHDIILGYQVAPLHTLNSIVELNGAKKKLKCKYCKKYEYEFPDNLQVYKGLGYPVYISENELSEIKTHHITKTFEHKEDVIISLELYEYLLKRYPKIECRPVFLGNVTADPEYVRLHKTKCGHKSAQSTVV